ncbi:hypothetical protein CVD28_03625 [Bacillus sp. M6-12]|uniref:hypothetical protein n=1 Tax=Bacillus sp. M6-12 TaxID=2054166 RepID=UPI000C76DEC6|nr:hypothetical protein [Bacillus sp. M6-12]PLS19517.1 hypothetical protein CVD28_03625 [Bacillus sp. M6-12]
MKNMDLEVKILSDFHKVKNTLKSISTQYQEDFLLEDIVFITVDDKTKLNGIIKYIEITDEQFAYQ